MVDMTGLDDYLPVTGEIAKCSETLVCRWRVVLPTDDVEQHRHLNKYTTPDFKNLGTLSLNGKKEEMRVKEQKTNRMLRWG